MSIPGRRGFYAGSDGSVWLELPRNVDPAQDGTSLAAHHPRIFATDDPLDSVPIAEFDTRLSAVVPPEVLARIDAVISAGIALAARGLADTPPLDLHEWRRGMILSWSHAAACGANALVARSRIMSRTCWWSGENRKSTLRPPP